MKTMINEYAEYLISFVVGAGILLIFSAIIKGLVSSLELFAGRLC